MEDQERKETYYVPKFNQTVDYGEFAGERDVEINALKKMVGKNNNAFMMGMRQLDEQVSSAVFEEYVSRKAKEQWGEQNTAWDVTKGFGEGVIKSPLRWAGYAASNTLPLIAKTATTAYAASGAAGGAESADKYIREANKGIEAWSKEIERLTGIDNAGTAEKVVGGAMGSVWGSVALGGTLGTGAVAPMFGVSAFQDTYTRQREAVIEGQQQVGMGEAAVRGIVHGTGEAALEALQFNRIFGNLAKKSRPIAIIKDLLENSVQEGLQQVNELGANWNIDNRALTEKLEEVGLSMAGGAIASLGGSVSGNVLNRKTVDEVSDLMKKAGRPEKEIKIVKDNLNKIVDSDELERAAKMVANDELTTIALTYKEQAQATADELVTQLDSAISRNELVETPTELPADVPPLYQLGEMQIDTQKNPSLGMVLYQAEQEGKPFETLGQVMDYVGGKLDVEQAQKMNTGINAVYKKTYDELKSIGQDDALADANARLRSTMAFAIANTYGGTVEGADRLFGNVVSQRASEFQGKSTPEENNTQIEITQTEGRLKDWSEDLRKEDDFVKNDILRTIIEREHTEKDARDVFEYAKELAEKNNYDYNFMSNLFYDIYMDKNADSNTKQEAKEIYNKLFNAKILLQAGDVAQRINEIDAEEQAKGVPEYTAPTININGVERQTANSEGNPIAKSEKSLRYFYDWFGDSKVVDGQGRPLVVYHGTNAEFDTFDMSKIINGRASGNAFYFTKNKGRAKGYGEITMPVYISAQNPFLLDDNKLDKNTFIYYAKSFLDFDDEKANKAYDDSNISNVEFFSLLSKKHTNETTEFLAKNGYDGVFSPYKSVDLVLAFDRNQIKSISNRGTYSLTEDNIYMQSAYAGSRVDYDRPSLEAIGSGEGQQVHGWGLYYALNKDVAEGYRETFTQDKFVLRYGDKTYTKEDGAIFDALNDTWFAGSKEDAIDGLQTRLDLKQYEGLDERDDIKKAIEFLENVDANKIELAPQGQVHEVDIPESPYLLDEQKKFSEQSPFVQEKLKELAKEYGGLREAINSDIAIGRDFYVRLGADLASVIEDVGKAIDEAPKLASKKLESVGIKGITYFGQQDGRCFVIFNPEDVKVIQKFYQDEANPRGAYYNNTVYLFENADQSTFAHEMAHSYMDVLERLAQSGNAQAQRDLAVIRNWLGKKQGEAFTQSDWERFARGFETYLREGKAPNEYLGGKGGVFERFKNWLMNIYAGIKSLTVTNEKGKQEPVKINKQIKEFYDEMLGGEDLDSVLKTAQENEQAMATIQRKMQELADLQQRLAEERAKLVREMANNVRPDTTWANVKDWGNNLWESARELPSNVLQSSYSRLAKIDPRLGLLVQRVEQSQGLRVKRWTDQIKPFYEAFNKLSAQDKAKVQFYLLNQQWGEVKELLGEDATESVQDMLKEIYEELVASGVDVGHRDNYFPRSVLDYDGLLQEMGLTYPALRKEMEEAIGKNATPEEQAEWLDKHIMGFRGTVSTQGNRNTKERKLDLITDKMAKYYKPSMETLVDYVEGMSKLLSMREAFGKDIEHKEGQDSIGKIIENMLGDKRLSKKQIDEVRNVLSALYLPNGMGNKFLQAMRQYGYATKLSYSTTVRQFADIGMMMKVNGVLNTLDALFHPDKRITLENLGIDPLGEEFKTSKKDIGGKVANFTTKWRGINWADAIMKNAYMRSSYKALQDLAKSPDKFHEKYDAMFGDETDTLIRDLNNDKLSEPVKVLLFHEISKIQPISRSAMPTAYLSNPNGRVFYMFKTFSLHRAEYMVSELADDFRRGDFLKAGKDIMADVAVIGWEGLVELLIAFLKYGWQAFVAKEVIDTFAGAGLGVLGLNKHQALQLSRGQVGDFFQEMIGVGTPLDDIGYMIRHYDDEDKLLRALLPDMIIEPLIAGPKRLGKK